MARRLAACIALIGSSLFGLVGCMTLEGSDPSEVTPMPVPSGVVLSGDAAPPPATSATGTTMPAPLAPLVPSDGVDAGPPPATDSGSPTSPDASAPSDDAPPVDDAAPSDDAATPPAPDADVPPSPDAPSDDAAEPDPPPPVGGQAVCPWYDLNCVGLLPPDSPPTP